MSVRLAYRIAAVLLLLFAVAHTLGFSQADPSWLFLIPLAFSAVITVALAAGAWLSAKAPELVA